MAEVPPIDQDAFIIPQNFPIDGVGWCQSTIWSVPRNPVDHLCQGEFRRPNIRTSDDVIADRACDYMNTITKQPV
jgi:hypothetical protein